MTDPGPTDLEPTATDVTLALADVADPDDAAGLGRFFKTGPGEYGEGDVFIGVRVPAIRAVAKRFAALPLAEIDALLDSAVHEHRLAALVILNARFAKAAKPRTLDIDAQAEMVRRYLDAVYRGRVNNWDLVDVSAENILGPWLLDRPRDLLFELADSESLWERRVALLTTFAFIKAGDASTTFALAERLLTDRRDLIQKALGWMLREVGKRIDRTLLTGFLDAHAAAMGRTALGYATEHLDPADRAAYRAL
ncbi:MULTISPECIES: DNA alkylation repair protein [Nocardia]|uniref:DNA alkylation repair protein n=1 Tax=Nocardia aurea TaxID=2144174 RepID=A0ABV3FWM4_9NOCA|nr:MULTISPECIES: DNA alkylation repair protein [Nocardia]